MGLDISTFTTTSPIEGSGSLTPYETIYEFAQDLIEECECIGEGQAFGWFRKNEIWRILNDFAMSEGLTDKMTDQIQDWVDGLPWDKHDCIQLYFNW